VKRKLIIHDNINSQHKFKLNLEKINLENDRSARESPKAENDNDYLMRTYQENSDKTRSGNTITFSSGKHELPIDEVIYDDQNENIENLV